MPSGIHGTLVFQEGKKADGEYYIASIYDQAECARIRISLYDLDKDRVCWRFSMSSNLTGLPHDAVILGLQ